MIPLASKSISLAARAAAVLSVYLLAPPLAAQTSFSTVRGTATDQTGSVVPGVNVTVTDVQTNVQRSAVTNQTGNFEIPDLKQGTYRLQAQAAGFKTFVAEELILESSQIRRVDVALQVGEAASEVTVNASAAVINVEESK